MRLLSCLATFVTVCAATYVPNQRCDNGRGKGVKPIPLDTTVRVKLEPGNGSDVRLGTRHDYSSGPGGLRTMG